MKKGGKSFIKISKQNRERAKSLRKEMTTEEKKIWYQFFRKEGHHWYKQKPMGLFILDFYCSELKLAVEIDGNQHYLKDGLLSDERRTDYLNKMGVTVHRVSNYDVNFNFEAVCREIKEIIEKRAPLSHLR